MLRSVYKSEDMENKLMLSNLLISPEFESIVPITIPELSKYLTENVYKATQTSQTELESPTRKMPYTAPPASKISPMFSPGEFTEVNLHSNEVPKEQVSTKHKAQSHKASKKTGIRCNFIPIGCNLIITGSLILIIAALAGSIAFMVTHPGLIGKPCPVLASLNEATTLAHTPTIIQTLSLNTTITTAQTADQSLPASQATGMARGIDPVAVATCLGVLENACVMENSPTSFGECDTLFEFFYCDLIDMRMFQGAMEPDPNGTSPICQPMKTFCSKATALNKKSL